MDISPQKTYKWLTGSAFLRGHKSKLWQPLSGTQENVEKLDSSKQWVSEGRCRKQCDYTVTSEHPPSRRQISRRHLHAFTEVLFRIFER